MSNRSLFVGDGLARPRAQHERLTSCRTEPRCGITRTQCGPEVYNPNMDMEVKKCMLAMISFKHQSLASTLITAPPQLIPCLACSCCSQCSSQTTPSPAGPSSSRSPVSKTAAAHPLR